MEEEGVKIGEGGEYGRWRVWEVESMGGGGGER